MRPRRENKGRTPQGRVQKGRAQKTFRVKPRDVSKSRVEPDQDDQPRPLNKQAQKARKEALFRGFSQVWESLWSSSVHLDSALSKLPPHSKSIIAQLLPTILLRPASQAEALGVGVPAGEPWSLSKDALQQWRPAHLMMERMYEMMAQGLLRSDPVRQDFPESMVKEWEEAWGTDGARHLIDTLGGSAPLSLRVSRNFDVSAVIQGLKQDDRVPVRIEPSSFAPLGIRLAGYASVLQSEWYQKGAFEIQDEGSQCMALFALWPEIYGSLLTSKPGLVSPSPQTLSELPRISKALTVIDACAGAGGKSLAMADALLGKGKVFAYDTSAKKLQALRRRASRTELRNIQVAAVTEGSEEAHVEKFKETADIVLVDAPCSGWGVLRRNPDIKWRQSADVLDRMPKIQHRLLDVYSKLVAPGGRLVFGVCTFRKEETLDIVSQFSAQHPEFSPQQGGFLGPGPCDGFFMQSFVKRA